MRSWQLLSAMCALTLASCGKNDQGHSTKKFHNQLRSDGATYKVIIRPVNNSLSGWIPNGVIDITARNDEIEVKGWLDDSANVTHLQAIHEGTECPEKEHDVNGDGLVDFYEATQVTGRVVLPLDGDLNSREDGSNFYPKGDYTYYQRAFISNMVRDLSIAGLTDELQLENRAVMILGAIPNHPLPKTVRRIDGLSAEASIPIACGIIQRMK